MRSERFLRSVGIRFGVNQSEGNAPSVHEIRRLNSDRIPMRETPRSVDHRHCYCCPVVVAAAVAVGRTGYTVLADRAGTSTCSRAPR